MRFLLLLLALPALASELSDDLKARRAKLMEQLGPRTMLLIESAPEKTYSLDVEYEYRQDSNFYYLTGIDQPDSTLVLMPGNTARREILFIKPKDPAMEHRSGRLLTDKEATARSGIETVYMTTEKLRFLATVLSGLPYVKERYAPRSADFDVFLKAIADGDAKLGISYDEAARIGGTVPAALTFANHLRDRFPGFAIRNVTSMIHNQRRIKTPYERKILEESVLISSDAHLAGMRAARSGAYEYNVKAAIEQVYRDRGALGWGYPSITGSGPNATILHYAKAGRRMDAGDLILVDAAASYQYYTGDITRTYPVSGKFSEAQKDLYRIVYQAQVEALKLAKIGTPRLDVERKTQDVAREGLLRLGLITDGKGDQYKTWFTHGTVHYLGLDVHDVGDLTATLQPGVAFVIEPGIYIQEDALDSLPKTKENLAMIEKVRPVFEKYRGIGVRLEDSFLMTEDGVKMLSSRVPRTIEEIEAFLAKR